MLLKVLLLLLRVLKDPDERVDSLQLPVVGTEQLRPRISAFPSARAQVTDNHRGLSKVLSWSGDTTVLWTQSVSGMKILQIFISLVL